MISQNFSKMNSIKNVQLFKNRHSSTGLLFIFSYTIKKKTNKKKHEVRKDRLLVSIKYTFETTHKFSQADIKEMPEFLFDIIYM
jgi:hypothetical protein